MTTTVAPVQQITPITIFRTKDRDYTLPEDIIERMKDPEYNEYFTAEIGVRNAGRYYRLPPTPLMKRGKQVRFSELFPAGQMTAVIGPLGSGKTTTLMSIASLAFDMGYTIVSNVALRRKNDKKTAMETGHQWTPITDLKGYHFVNNFADLITLLAKLIKEREKKMVEKHIYVDDNFEPILLIIDEWAQLVNPLKQMGAKSNNVRQFIRYIRKLGIHVIAASPNTSDFSSYFLPKRTKSLLGEEKATGMVNQIISKDPELIYRIGSHHFLTWGNENLFVLTDPTSMVKGEGQFNLFLLPRGRFSKHADRMKAGEITFDTTKASTFESGRFPDGTEVNMEDFLSEISQYEDKQVDEAIAAYVKKHSVRVADHLEIDVKDPFFSAEMLKVFFNAAQKIIPYVIDDAFAKGVITDKMLREHLGAGAIATWSNKNKKYDAPALTRLAEKQFKELLHWEAKTGRPKGH